MDPVDCPWCSQTFTGRATLKKHSIDDCDGFRQSASRDTAEDSTIMEPRRQSHMQVVIQSMADVQMEHEKSPRADNPRTSIFGESSASISNTTTSLQTDLEFPGGSPFGQEVAANIATAHRPTQDPCRYEQRRYSAVTAVGFGGAWGRLSDHLHSLLGKPSASMR